MSEFKCNIGEISVFEYDYDNYKGKEELNSLQAEGIAYRFSKWLIDYGYEDETADEVYNNTSGIRDGNRLDIMENYPLFDSDLEITFLYSVNGTVWAVLYDPVNNNYFGEFELPCA